MPARIIEVAASPYIPPLPPLRAGVEREMPPGQHRMLVAIHAHVAEHGAVPTVRQLGDALGIGSPNGVMSSLRALMRRGFIYRCGRGTSKNYMLGVLCFEAEEPAAV